MRRAVGVDVPLNPVIAGTAGERLYLVVAAAVMSHPASDYAHGLAAVPTNRMATYPVVSTRDLLA